MEHFRIYETLDSTNKEALRLLAEGQYLHETAILALHQTSGRGQYGREWHATPGEHLALSVILQPVNMFLTELPLLSMKTSLAIIRTLQSIIPGIQLHIKWPNDIYSGDRKLSGILIENSISSTQVQHSIIGIGMNVNEAHFPENLPNPVSLFIMTGNVFDIPSLAQKMRTHVINIMDEPIEKWKPEYDQKIYGRDQVHQFDWNGKIISAKIMGIENDGKMRLYTDDQESKLYFSHEIKWVK